MLIHECRRAEVVRTAMDRDIGGVHCRTEHGPNYWRAISMTSLHDLGHNTTPIALESNVAAPRSLAPF